MAARSLSEHEESRFGVLPILGIHRTMDPLEDRKRTLCMQQGMFMDNLSTERKRDLG